MSTATPDFTPRLGTLPLAGETAFLVLTLELVMGSAIMAFSKTFDLIPMGISYHFAEPKVKPPKQKKIISHKMQLSGVNPGAGQINLVLARLKIVNKLSKKTIHVC
jgi:hypothetical protein